MTTEAKTLDESIAAENIKLARELLDLRSAHARVTAWASKVCAKLGVEDDRYESFIFDHELGVCIEARKTLQEMEATVGASTLLDGFVKRNIEFKDLFTKLVAFVQMTLGAETAPPASIQIAAHEHRAAKLEEAEKLLAAERAAHVETSKTIGAIAALFGLPAQRPPSLLARLYEAHGALKTHAALREALASVDLLESDGDLVKSIRILIERAEEAPRAETHNHSHHYASDPKVASCLAVARFAIRVVKGGGCLTMAEVLDAALVETDHGVA